MCQRWDKDVFHVNINTCVPERWRYVWFCCTPRWPVWLWSSQDGPRARGSAVRGQSHSLILVVCSRRFFIRCWWSWFYIQLSVCPFRRMILSSNYRGISCINWTQISSSRVVLITSKLKGVACNSNPTHFLSNSANVSNILTLCHNSCSCTGQQWVWLRDHLCLLWIFASPSVFGEWVS